jgi:hypothetical protein
VDTEAPAEKPVHIYSTDLQGVAAVQATGEDGEEYCIIDSGVIVGNPEAREYANRVYIRACRRAARRQRPGFAT